MFNHLISPSVFMKNKIFLILTSLLVSFSSFAKGAPERPLFNFAMACAEYPMCPFEWPYPAYGDISRMVFVTADEKKI